MLKKVISFTTSILDSTPFAIFFAAWTGIYLVQVLKGKTGAPTANEGLFIILFFIVGLIII